MNHSYTCTICNDQGVYLRTDGSLAYCRCPEGKKRALDRIRQLSSPLIEEWTWSSAPGFEGFSTTVAGVSYESLAIARDLAKTFAEQIISQEGKNGWCLYFSGPTGSGKTHLAMSVFQYLLDHAYTDIAVIHAWDLKDRGIKAMKEDKLQQLIDLYAKIGVLIIDDLGAETNSEWNESFFFALIDRRWNRRAWMLITSNYPLEQLPQRVRSRLLDQDYGIEVVFPGIDYRLSKERPSLFTRVRRFAA